MRIYFDARQNAYWAEDPHVANNVYLTMEAECTELPQYDDIKDKLPIPVWPGHDSAIACYNKTWEICWRNLRKPVAEAGFVSNFIETAFNGDLFMWDSSFIVMFARYAIGTMIYANKSPAWFTCALQ